MLQASCPCRRPLLQPPHGSCKPPFDGTSPSRPHSRIFCTVSLFLLVAKRCAYSAALASMAEGCGRGRGGTGSKGRHGERGELTLNATTCCAATPASRGSRQLQWQDSRGERAAAREGPHLVVWVAPLPHLQVALKQHAHLAHSEHLSVAKGAGRREVGWWGRAGHPDCLPPPTTMKSLGAGQLLALHAVPRCYSFQPQSIPTLTSLKTA